MANGIHTPLLHDTQTMARLREFEFSNEDFEALRRLVRQITGINLSDQKRELVYGRLRIWSAGCSTGEEAYSIAMTILEALPDVRRWDVRILATDLDSDVLERGRRGVYTEERVKNLSLQRRARFFRELGSRDGPCYEVAPQLKSLITFKQLNLMHPLPLRGPLDAIFCRNVVIYFDKETQRDLFARMAQLQQPANLLFLGHSESLFKVSEQDSLIGKTAYRRAG